MAKIAVWVLFALLFVADLNADWLAPGVSLVIGGPTSGNVATDAALFRALLWAVAALITSLAQRPAGGSTDAAL